MKAHFQRLYQYNAWANDLFADVLATSPFENKKLLVLFSHIASAQLIWLNRIEPIDESIPGVWEEMSLTEAIDDVKRSSQLWSNYLDGDLDFSSMIDYVDSRGQEHQTKLEEIVTHVANHGTHHRGQIATLLRQENIAPPASDYIFFSRAVKNLS